MNPNGLFVSSSGNVGVGTPTPSAKLEVNGYGTANSIMTYVSAKFYGGGTGGVNIGTDGTVAMIATDSSDADMQFLTRVAGVFSPRITIKSGGNVGIGTSNPSDRLTITDASTYTFNVGAASGGAGAVLYTLGSAALTFATSGSSNERMRITSGGDLELKGRSTTTNFQAVFYNANDQFAINATNTSTGKTINFNPANTFTALSLSATGAATFSDSIKTGEPDTGYGRAAFKIGSRQTGEANTSGGYIPISIDGTVYFINLYTSTP
jgi:hypothetical protein